MLSRQLSTTTTRQFPLIDNQIAQGHEPETPSAQSLHLQTPITSFPTPRSRRNSNPTPTNSIARATPNSHTKSTLTINHATLQPQNDEKLQHRNKSHHLNYATSTQKTKPLLLSSTGSRPKCKPPIHFTSQVLSITRANHKSKRNEKGEIGRAVPARGAKARRYVRHARESNPPHSSPSARLLPKPSRRYNARVAEVALFLLPPHFRDNTASTPTLSRLHPQLSTRNLNRNSCKGEVEASEGEAGPR